MFRPLMLAIFRLYMNTYQVVIQTYAGCLLKTTHKYLYNYLICVHVQSENGQHQWSEHVVVPNVVNT